MSLLFFFLNCDDVLLWNLVICCGYQQSRQSKIVLVSHDEQHGWRANDPKSNQLQGRTR